MCDGTIGILHLYTGKSSLLKCQIRIKVKLRTENLKPIASAAVYEKNTSTMGLFKTALIGAAVYGAVKYLTKKDALGYSKMDEIKEKAPEWLEKAKAVTAELKPGTNPQI